MFGYGGAVQDALDNAIRQALRSIQSRGRNLVQSYLRYENL